MIERLPKDCSPLINNLARSIGKKAKLGFEVKCSSNGKNKFKLKADVDGKGQDSQYLVFGYNSISIPAIGYVFNHVYPDFILKPTEFMPLGKLIDEFKLNKQMLAFEIMKRMRLELKSMLNEGYAEKGISLVLNRDRFAYWKENTAITPAFKSFSEFLVWIDLNVK